MSKPVQAIRLDPAARLFNTFYCVTSTVEDAKHFASFQTAASNAFFFFLFVCFFWLRFGVSDRSWPLSASCLSRGGYIYVCMHVYVHICIIYTLYTYTCV